MCAIIITIINLITFMEPVFFTFPPEAPGRDVALLPETLLARQ
jgi:hypothetical protein